MAGVSNLRENFVKVRNFDKVIKTKEIHSNRFKSLPSGAPSKKSHYENNCPSPDGSGIFCLLSLSKDIADSSKQLQVLKKVY
jgi:hypothetical protein